MSVAEEQFHAICLYRSANLPPFCLQDRRIMRILHDEIGVLLSNGKLARATPFSGNQEAGHLSPREQQTLEGLLEGLSEKQVARRLGIGRTTVHTYVGALHRRFNVGSRAELLSTYWRNNQLALP